MGPLSREIMTRALETLDQKLKKIEHAPVTLIMGGGGAMILAHGFPLATTDVDAIPKGISFEELDPLVKEIADEQGLPKDWLNPHFSSFSHTLPSDYADRLINVHSGSHLQVLALGKEEMLIMKCFAHRRKDVGHARALVRDGANLDLVENRIEELEAKRIPGTQAAFDFLQEILELEGK